ncbi:MAG: metallophosphoesterase family protein [Pseudomonadota bacterium]
MILVVPDIHGHKQQLDRVLALADAQFGKDAPIVFLGDLVDRGPDSCGVIEALIRGIDAGRNWTVICGNHDQLFLEYIDGGDPATPGGLSWLHERMGGRETLASYGAEEITGRDRAKIVSHIPVHHSDFLRALPLVHQVDEALFVHAGIRPGVPLKAQLPQDLTWIRGEFLNDPRDHGPLIIHGHTPVDAPTHYGNRVNLDAGAGYGRDLVIAVLRGRDVSLLSAEGETPLIPQAAT